MRFIILLFVLWHCEESTGKLRISNKNKIDGDTSTGIQGALRYKYRYTGCTEIQVQVYRVYRDKSAGTSCTEIQVQVECSDIQVQVKSVLIYKYKYRVY